MESGPCKQEFERNWRDSAASPKTFRGSLNILRQNAKISLGVPLEPVGAARIPVAVPFDSGGLPTSGVNTILYE